MEIPELWIPIPLMYGVSRMTTCILLEADIILADHLQGFFVTLSGRELDVVLYEVVVDQVWPRKTNIRLTPTC